MKKYSPSSEINEFSEFSRAGVELFAKVMARATSSGPWDKLSAFSHLSTPVDLQLAGPFEVA
jgi:hypothetical protein